MQNIPKKWHGTLQFICHFYSQFKWWIVATSKRKPAVHWLSIQTCFYVCKNRCSTKSTKPFQSPGCICYADTDKNAMPPPPTTWMADAKTNLKPPTRALTHMLTLSPLVLKGSTITRNTNFGWKVRFEIRVSTRDRHLSPVHSNPWEF